MDHEWITSGSRVDLVGLKLVTDRTSPHSSTAIKLPGFKSPVGPASRVSDHGLWSAGGSSVLIFHFGKASLQRGYGTNIVRLNSTVQIISCTNFPQGFACFGVQQTLKTSRHAWWWSASNRSPLGQLWCSTDLQQSVPRPCLQHPASSSRRHGMNRPAEAGQKQEIWYCAHESAKAGRVPQSGNDMLSWLAVHRSENAWKCGVYPKSHGYSNHNYVSHRYIQYICVYIYIILYIPQNHQFINILGYPHFWTNPSQWVWTTQDRHARRAHLSSHGICRLSGLSELWPVIRWP